MIATSIDTNRIRWGRIVAGALLLELVLVVVFIPIALVVDIARIIPFVPIGTFVVGVWAGWWVARKATGRRVLHGTLAGVLATVLYLGLCMLAPGGLAEAVAVYGTPLFVVANALRIVGCAAGGYFYKV